MIYRVKNVILWTYIIFIYIPFLTNFINFFALYYYWVNSRYSINFKREECLICYETPLFVKYIDCNKPFEHIICKVCYENIHYNRLRCHFCQVPISITN